MDNVGTAGTTKKYLSHSFSTKNLKSYVVKVQKWTAGRTGQKKANNVRRYKEKNFICDLYTI